MDAKFSLPYALAVAVANRRVVLADFDAENLTNDRYLSLASKVHPVYEESPTAPAAAISPLTVSIETVHGTFSQTVERPRGLEKASLVDKFRDCASRSVQPLSATQVERVIDLVERLDEVEDVRELTAALTA
jgi:2-methylcitrate dehydratase PrpD